MPAHRAIPTSEEHRASADAYRFDVFARYGYPLGLASHAALIFLFEHLGQTVLSRFNVLSVVLWAAAIVFHRRGWIRLGFLCGMAEVLCYTVLGTVWLGWQSGVFVFFMFPVIAIFFVPGLTDAAKGRVIAAVAALMIALVALTEHTGALQPLGPELARRFLASNMLLLVLGAAVCLLAFSRAIRAAEDRLTRFSHAVSEYLDPMLVGGLREGVDLSPRQCFVTVFFADLADSTRISAQMSETCFGSMMQEFVFEMQRIVKAHRGYLEDISGDGIFGYVGSFDSRGAAQDAADVVEMARRMQARLAELSPEFEERFGLPGPLRMRIGISSGAAIVGKTAGARAIYTANGESVNLGAKLEQALKDVTAEGGILLSAETASLVEGRFALARHTVTIAGREVDAYVVD